MSGTTVLPPELADSMNIVYSCPVCGEMVYHANLNTRPESIEIAAELHLRLAHPWRFWLWRHLGWRWLLKVYR